MIPYHIRKAYLHECESIREHLVPIHLKLSARNEQELADQIKELPDDFPALYDDNLFTNCEICHYLLAVSDFDNSMILGSIGILDDIEPVITCSDKQTSLSEQKEQQSSNNNDKVFRMKRAKLNSFFTSVEYQHMGIGSALMKEALKQAKLRKIQQIDLLTMREVYDNAITCYLKFGFQIVKEYTVPNGHYKLVDMSLFL